MAKSAIAVSSEAPAEPDFGAALQAHGFGPLRRRSPDSLQVNVGKLCNQACHHCHVDAGPGRKEIMARATAERAIAVLRGSPAVTTLDLTGGAPELNPSFRWMVERARELGRRVIDRCNLTVLQVAGMQWLPDFLREHRVELVCSLPCYTAENVDRQRGDGVFAASIEALRGLNRAGYGIARSGLMLDLVYNPVGALLAPPQTELEQRYREELRRHFGIEFNHLLTITNMPIHRFARQLRNWGRYQEYMGLLVNHFNPATVAGLMCLSLISVSWDGLLYDCDFNQMAAIALGAGRGRRPLTIWDVDDLASLQGLPVATATHCFGCTAGAGSSCGGAII